MVLLQITLLLLLLHKKEKSLFFLPLFVLGRCKCSRASHSQYLQRPFGLPHFLAHFCHHGSTDVRWKILQGKKRKKGFANLTHHRRSKSGAFFFSILIFPKLTVRGHLDRRKSQRGNRAGRGELLK